MYLSDQEADAFAEIVRRFEDARRPRSRRAVCAVGAAVLVAAVAIVHFDLGWPWPATAVFTIGFLFGLVGGLRVMAQAGPIVEPLSRDRLRGS